MELTLTLKDHSCFLLLYYNITSCACAFLFFHFIICFTYSCMHRIESQDYFLFISESDGLKSILEMQSIILNVFSSWQEFGMAVPSPGLPVWPCRSGLCMWDSSRLQTEGTSQQGVHGTEGRRRQRTGQMDCGGRSSTGGRLSGSSHRLPKSCGSEWYGDI